MINLYDLLRDLFPPIIFRNLKKIFKKKSIRGSFKDWQQAKLHSTGYDANEILAKVLEATLLAIDKDGYERDGVYFSSQEYCWPVVLGVLLGYLKNFDGVRVLDFGGALGGLYLQHKKLLSVIPNLKWDVVEQPHFIAAAIENIQIQNLNFHHTLFDYLVNSKPNVLIFSSVLQYLEDPDRILHEMANSSAQYLIIDRTPFHNGNSHIIKVQHVPVNIYKGSYPIRIFSKSVFLEKLNYSWTRVASGFSPEGVIYDEFDNQISFEWLIMKKINV